MRCKIAEILTEVPEAGGMAPRCKEYLSEESGEPRIIIYEKDYTIDRWDGLDEQYLAYMDSGLMFYTHLLRFCGLMIHASAVAKDGRAYLFSAPCGTGKSTHTKLWQQTFGPAAQVFNDDKPALRRIDGKWYAYGTPWCGKDGINQNKKVPLAGICFLKQAPHNRIRQLSTLEAIQKIVPQTCYKFGKVENLDLMLSHVEKLATEIPVFELENRPEPEAALLSYETMRRKAEEIGL